MSNSTVLRNKQNNQQNVQVAYEQKKSFANHVFDKGLIPKNTKYIKNSHNLIAKKKKNKNLKSDALKLGKASEQIFFSQIRHGQ